MMMEINDLTLGIRCLEDEEVEANTDVREKDDVRWSGVFEED
jgi:hypothetical protein